MTDLEKAKDEMIRVLKDSLEEARRKNRRVLAENAAMRSENDLLRRLLASAIGDKAVILRYEGATPELTLFENISGETIARLSYDKKV